jgi:hypothetical protein
MAMVESTLPPSASKIRVRSGWWYTWKTFESKIYPKIASPKAAIRNESLIIVVVEVAGVLCSGYYTYSSSYSSANK